MNEEATEYEKERQIVEKVNIKTSKWVKVRVFTSLIDRALSFSCMILVFLHFYREGTMRNRPRST
jgi:hypothetical protein